MDAYAAARMGDQIAHGFGLLAMVAGAVAGAVVGATIIGATVASGGAALAIMTGAIAAGGLGLGQLVKGLTTVFNLPEPTTGLLTGGSPDILIDYLPAMRVGDMAAACSGLPFNHPSLPAVLIAEGSATVFFNGRPAARVSSKMVCGAHIKSGSPTVIIGGPTVRTHFVWDVEQWAQWSLIGLGVFSLVVAGRGAWAKEGIFGLTKLAGYAGGGLMGFEGLGQLGDRLGPGYRDVLQGVAGLVLLGLGPMLAGKNSAGAAAEDAQSAKNRSLLAEESSEPWYDKVLNAQKSELPVIEQKTGPVLQDDIGLPWVTEREFPPVIREAGQTNTLEDGNFAGARGNYSTREFDPELAGGPLHELSADNIKFTERGISVVESHTARFGPDPANQHMIARLRQIVNGKIEPTSVDRNFYSHELREFVRYRQLGWENGQPADQNTAYSLWNNAHTATLEEYKIFGPNTDAQLYHLDAIKLMWGNQ